ncbi:MAG TPA: cytochrome c oxidase subunit II [Terriglobia bacterium]|nr:cytochrome c oxidase subunit II [Terriglobia bacterium]
MLCLFPLFPREASTMAPSVDRLMLFTIAVSVFFAALIFILLFYFAIKYRRRSDDEIPVQIHGSIPLEIIWTVIPIFVVIILFVWGVDLYVQNQRPPTKAVHVYVVGKQWMWRLQHPEGPREINALHIPVGVPVELIMTSQDVIHDFSVPAFRVKMDVLPDRYTTLWFTPSQTGEFRFYCDQYCGTFHSHMRGYVDVMTPRAYAQWLSGGMRQTISMAEEGAKLYESYGCVTCHGTGKAPPYVGLYGSTVRLEGGQTVIANDAYIRQSILEPSSQIVEGYKPIMPTFQGQISEEQILEIIAYIKSLATTPGPQGAAPAKETK